MDNTASLLQNYLHGNNLLLPETFDYPLFRNNQGRGLGKQITILAGGILCE